MHGVPVHLTLFGFEYSVLKEIGYRFAARPRLSAG